MGRRLDTWPYGRTAFMDVTYTQANAGGGAIVCEISPGAGCEFIVMQARQINTGTHSCTIASETAVGGSVIVSFAFVASAATTSVAIGIGTTATAAASANLAGVGWPTIIAGTQALKVLTSEAGVQNDTMRVLCNIRVKGGLPTVTHANSTNPANVSVTAGAESFATV